MERYLASLPNGLASYPEHVAKASLLRQFLADLDTGKLAPSLPPPLATLVRAPPPVSSWMSEVELNAIMLAAYESCFGADEARLCAYARDGNMKMLSGPLYRALFLVASPERILRGVASRWSTLRRGTTLKMLSLTDGAATFLLEFPPRLLPDVLARMRTVSFQVVLELAGAKQVDVKLTKLDDTSAAFVASWH